MVDDVVNLLAVELMQDGHDDGSVGQRCHKGYGPVGRIAPTDGYAVSFPDAGSLHHDVQLLYLSRYVVILQRSAFIVGQRIE